jgi:thymidylate kinase
MIKKYRYIAIEGIDGSGKTTIANLLYNELSKRYNKVIFRLWISISVIIYCR